MLQHSFIKFNSYLDVVICPIFSIKMGNTNTSQRASIYFLLSVVMLVYNNKTHYYYCVVVCMFCICVWFLEVVVVTFSCLFSVLYEIVPFLTEDSPNVQVNPCDKSHSIRLFCFLYPQPVICMYIAFVGLCNQKTHIPTVSSGIFHD